MSKVSKIDQIHIRVCPSMYVEDVKDAKTSHTYCLMLEALR